MMQHAVAAAHHITMACVLACLPIEPVCKAAHLKMQGLMLQEWNEALLANDDYWDQNAFNDLMNRGARFAEQRSDRLFL